MPRSMTGFGRSQYSGKRYAVELEIRSLNNRFLKVRIHAPSTISILEAEIEDFLRTKLSRGAVDVWIRVTDINPAEAYRLDMEVVRKYREFAASLSSGMGIHGSLDVSDYMALPGVVAPDSQDSDIVDQLRPVTMELVEKGLEALGKMREKEGDALAADIRSRAKVLAEVVAKIKQRVPAFLSAYRDRLLSRIRELLSGSGVEIGRDDLVKEVAIFAERSDVSEELARIDSHLAQLLDALSGDEIGRKLEFVAQELHREVNTIGSKSGDPETSRLVVEAKGEVDRIREQAANLE